MLKSARGTVYWPGMAGDLKHLQVVSTCEVCREFKPRTSKPLPKQHDNGHTPWNKIGRDLFVIKDRNYLVAIHYFSNFIEIDFLQKITSNAVNGILKKQFARLGIPTTIVSDGGPQFTANDFRIFTENGE